MSESNTTYRAFPDKLGGSDSTKFVGDKGELFWDPENANLSMSDGQTPGGIGIKTRNLEAFESNKDASQWLTLFGDFAGDWRDYYGSGSAVDSNGFLWVVGGYENNFNKRATLSVFDANGEMLFPGAGGANWRFVYDGSDADHQYGEAIAIHKDSENGDSVYVVISTDDVTDEIILAKVSSSGMGIDLEWAREIDGSNSEEATDVIVDAQGYVYVCGSTRSQGVGYREGFIAKFNPDGDCLWKQIIEGSGFKKGEALAIDGSHLYVVGQTTNSGQGGADIFVAKLSIVIGDDDTAPTFVWQKTIGLFDSGSWEYGYGVAVGTSGNVYVTGRAVPTELMASSSIYVAKLNSAGAIVWQKSLTDTDYSYGAAVSLDAAENIYLSGYVDVDYPEGEQTIAPQYEDLIIAKYSSDGEFKYAKSFGTKYLEDSFYNWGHRSLTVDGEYIFISGYTKNIDRTNSNGFVARFRADGEFEGVYGDFVAQTISMQSVNTNLVLADAELTLTDADDIDVNNLVVGLGEDFYLEEFDNTSPYPYDGHELGFRTFSRSPYEIRVRGVISADTTITRELNVNGISFSNTGGDDRNICIGAGGGSNHDGADNNIYLGYLAGFRNAYGDDNIFMGSYAGNQNVEGDHNIYLGRESGETATGDGNVFIGGYAGQNQTGGDNNVILGYDIDVDDSSGSNQLKIGSNGSWWLKGDSGRSVTVKHDLKFEDAGTGIYMKSPNGHIWQILMTNGGEFTITDVT
jgi:hypothetical protein